MVLGLANITTNHYRICLQSLNLVCDLAINYKINVVMATNSRTMTKAPKGRISKLFNAVAWWWEEKLNPHPHLLATMAINHRTCTPLCFCNKIVSRLIIKINFLTLTEEKCEAREFMEWTCTTSAPASPWGRINHPQRKPLQFSHQLFLSSFEKHHATEIPEQGMAG